MSETTRESRVRYRCAAAVICVAVLMIVFASIGVRFITRQLLIKRWGWNNTFTRAVFWDMPNLRDQNAASERYIDWEEIYPFVDAKPEERDTHQLAQLLERADRRIRSIEKAVTYYATDALAGYRAVVRIAGRYDGLLGARQMSRRDVLSMENGHLADETALLASGDIEATADGIADFARFLESLDTPFIFMNAGTKVCPVDKQLRPTDISREMSNENSDALLAALESRGVATLDFRKELIASGRDWYGECYYKTDHHWTTGAALWAAGVIVRILNKNYGFDFDEKYFDTESYTIDRREAFILGSVGRKIASTLTRRDSFDVYLPRFETKFHLVRISGGIDRVGSFADSLMNMSLLDEITHYSDEDHLVMPDAYDGLPLTNIAPLLSVENLLPNQNCDKRILLIRDSFCNYVIPFLACGVGSVDAISPAVFTGSIRRFVEQTSPDIVIMIPYARNIERPDLRTHTGAFDLR